MNLSLQGRLVLIKEKSRSTTVVSSNTASKMWTNFFSNRALLSMQKAIRKAMAIASIV